MSFSYSLCYQYAPTDGQDVAVAETALIKLYICESYSDPSNCGLN